MLENIYSCWILGEDEGDAEIVKAATPEDAAQVAADTVRHETITPRNHDIRVKVYVKDKYGSVSEFEILSHAQTGRDSTLFESRP